jgi:tRNA(adenine34) deaminase
MTCDCCGARGPSRRSVVAGLAGVGLLSASDGVTGKATDPSTAEDERFMRIAIEEASRGDYPFGAVIVRDGRIIARGRNLGRTKDDPTAHAEMVTIRHGLASDGSAALRGSTIYASGEPCAMCMGAILWCHFGRLVFAASIDQLATRIDEIMISSRELAAKTPFAPIAISGGVLADEAMKLFSK